MPSLAAMSHTLSQLEEDASSLKLAHMAFDAAYAQLRQICPQGDLTIHLSIVPPAPLSFREGRKTY